MIFLIGHRGVGKTSLLSSLKKEFKCSDLDTEIESHYKTRVSDIFKEEGEDVFRIKEVSVLKKILNEEKDVVALGAGFNLKSLPKRANDLVIWIKRVTDKKGRSFLNRPRLNNTLSPLKEYQDRFEKREELYLKYSDFDLVLPEDNLKPAAKLIKLILKNKSEHSEKKIKPLFKSFLTFGLDKSIFKNIRYEYRTDISSEEQILENVKDGDLISIRNSVEKSFLEEILKRDVLVDIPLDFKEDYNFNDKERIFFSSHEISDFEIIKNTLDEGFHVKWAPLIKNFKQLIAALNLIKDLDISFLPRDNNSSRWQWYRLIRSRKNKINFFRFSKGSDLSQPFWYQDFDKAKNENENKSSNENKGEGDYGIKAKACLIGDPVEHSFSPAFHYDFFNGEYVNIQIKKEELTREVLDFITSCGVNCFSVTSPHKMEVARLLNLKEAINTLYYDGSKYLGENTDSLAIKVLIDELKDKKVCIWGAGAIGSQFQEKLKNSRLYSVREASQELLEEDFEVLLWCAGQTVLKPRFKNLPQEVYDIDYSDSSSGKEFAVENNLKYQSGLEFFYTQAKAQQAWWKKVSRL